MSDLDQVYSAFQQAHDAKDTASAQRLADYIRSRANTGAPGTEAPSNTPPPQRPQGYQPALPQSMPAGPTEGMPDPSSGDMAAISPTTPYSQNQLAAAKSGVNIDNRAPFGAQMRASFGGDSPQEQLSAVSTSLAKSYGHPVQVQMGPKSKQIEYMDPDTNSWTLAKGNPIAQLPANAIDPVLQGAGSVGGTIAGGAMGGVPGAVAGGVAGAGVGGGAATALKIGVGKALGVLPDTYPTGSNIEKGAVIGSAFDLGGKAVLGALRYGSYWYKGSAAFKPAEALQLVQEAKKSDDLVNEIAQKSGIDFSPAIGQRVAGTLADKPVGQLALSLEAGIAKDSGGMGPTYLAKRKTNENALVGYLRNAGDEAAGPSTGVPPEQIGKNLQQGLTSFYDTTMTQARQLVSTLPEELQASEGGKILRNALVDARQTFKNQVETPAWGKYQNAAGYDPATQTSNIRVPWDNQVRGLMSAWDNQTRNAVLKAAQKDNSGLKILFKTDDPAMSSIVGKDGMPLKVADGTGDVDLQTLDDTIKWLRSDGRDALRNQIGATYNDYDLQQLTKTLVKQRDGYLKANKPELYSMLQDAEGATRMRANKFDDSAVGDLLVKDGPDSFKLTDSQVVGRIMNANDDSAAKQYADLVKQSPEANMQAKQLLYAMYRRAVVNPKTGAPDATLHSNFMRDYGNVVKNFFSPEDMDTLGKMGGMGEVIADQTSLLKRILPQMDRLSGGDITSWNSSSLTKWALKNDTGPDKVKTALALLRNAPDADALQQGWQRSTLDSLNDMVVKDGQISMNGLNKVLQGNQRANLTALLGDRGPDYISNLEKLRDATTMARSASDGTFTPDQKSLLTRMARLVFGQFTPEARVVTFGQSTRRVVNPTEIYNTLTDPDKLQSLTQQTDKLMGQIKLAGTSAAAGRYFMSQYGNAN